jgi:hypothetical protein
LGGDCRLIRSLPEDGLELLNRLSHSTVVSARSVNHLNAVVFKQNLTRSIGRDQPNGRNLAIHRSLHIGELMQRYLWHEKSSVI